MGQLPASAWDNTIYEWGEREGFAIAKGWHFSAFVEMTGALFFDEANLAPESLGKSHLNYLEASLSVAQRSGHQIYGYAPACDAKNPYAEFGLDRPETVSPYAAALLTLTGDPRALMNLDRILQALPRNGAPLADGIDARTGQVSCGVARTLDQGLLFLSLNADVVRSLVQRTNWYGSAEQRLRAMDVPFRAPNKPMPRPKPVEELPVASNAVEAPPSEPAAVPATDVASAVDVALPAEVAAPADSAPPAADIISPMSPTSRHDADAASETLPSSPRRAAPG
jgi:hypothetical protein